MNNPFRYGGIVSGDAFCNREHEVTELLAVMRNGDKLFLVSERRLGKTSLVHRALARLPKAEYVAAYVDLWPTEDEVGFAVAVARAVTTAMASRADRLLATARRFFSQLRPGVTLDEEGKPTVTFGVERQAPGAPGLEEVLAVPARIAAEGGRRVVVVLDEFQQILQYGSPTVERRLRSIVQGQEEVCYLFLGSRKHLISRMILEPAQPLYRAGMRWSLGPIAEEHWQPYISAKFAATGRMIDAGQVSSVFRLTDGHPFHTQALCHALWELCDEGEAVTDSLVTDAMRRLLEREGFAFSTLWESLPASQRRLLRAIAHAESPSRPFAAEVVRRYGLRSASSVQRAAGALLARDVIDREAGSFVIADRFFRLWIRRLDS
jgi:uncharacterized protein